MVEIEEGLVAVAAIEKELGAVADFVRLLFAGPVRFSAELLGAIRARVRPSAELPLLAGSLAPWR